MLTIKCKKQRRGAWERLLFYTFLSLVHAAALAVVPASVSLAVESPSISADLDPRHPGPLTARETIKKVRDSLNRIKPFKVSFLQQVYTDEQLDIEESGKIIFKNDRLLKWTYLDPDYKVFLLEGDNYQFYDEDNEQLIIGKIKDRSHQWVWQLLFSDDVFRHYLVGWDEGQKKIRIKNNPGSHTGDTDDMSIDIEILINNDFLPIKVIQKDPSGALIVYHFKEYKPGIELASDTFRLKVPEDVEVIRQ
ncbi:MAG: outer membrane lipoprotein carrier protein LolA [Candidatus Aminicenantes bacterium]|nr:MAG: outer membrane lipoprotein carrier protein LolA [Candidatus Aminicenantes bacterium]